MNIANNLICTICQCRLNGPGPLNQHLASSNHIKKVEIKKALLSSQISDLVCSAGDSLSNNVIHHKDNKAHLDNDEKATLLTESGLVAKSKVNLNFLGLGDGIQVYYQKVTPYNVQCLWPEKISNLVQDVNQFDQKVDSSTVTMNNLVLRPQRGPNGEPYVMRGDKGMCYVCNVELTSPQLCQQHIQGNKHIKKVNESANRNIGNMFQPIIGNTYSSVPPSIAFQRESSVSRTLGNRGPNGKEYDVAGPGGRCFVCSVDFTSVELAKEHLAGQKHRKKVASQSLFEGEGGPLPGMVSSGQVTGHISSNMVSPGQITGNIPSNMVSSGQITGHIPSNMVSPGQVTGNIPSNMVSSGQITGNIPSNMVSSGQMVPNIIGYFPSTGVSSHSTLPPSRGPNGQEYIMEDNTGYCFVCRLELTSPAHAQSHLSGKKHKKKCSDGIFDNTSGANGVLMCSICNVPFSSIENARQHFVCEKHKNKDRQFQLGKNAFSQETQKAIDTEETQIKNVYQPSVQLAPLHGDSCLNDLTRDSNSVFDSKLLNPIRSGSSLFHSNISSFHPPEQTQIMKVYQPSVQLAPLHGDSSLNDHTRDSNSVFDSKLLNQISSGSQLFLSKISSFHPLEDADTGFSDKSIQFSDLSSTPTQESESQPIYDQSDHHCRSPVLGQNNSLEIDAVPVEIRSDEVTEATVKTEIEQQNIAHTGTRNTDIPQDDNLSYNKLNELSKVGNKRMENHRTDFDIHENVLYGDSLTDNNLQPPIKKSSTKGTFNDPIEAEHFLSVKQNNPEASRFLPKTSHAEMNEHQKNSHEQQEAEFQQQQEYLHLPDSVISNSDSAAPLVESGEPILENVLSHLRRTSLLSDTSTATTAHIPGPYLFDGFRGQCFCCSVELTSMQHANQHLNGKKHQKKLGQWDLTQKLNFEPSTQTIPFQRLSSAPDSPKNDIAEDDSYYFNGSRGFCHVCNIELTSLQHKQQHINGKPHKRSQERSSLSKKGVTYPLSCEICQKFFSGQESAQQHFTSSKHKSKVDVMNDSVQVLTVIDDGRVIMKDGQTWYLCDVCKVPLNTREQFFIHKDSPKHKRECENNKIRNTAYSDTVQNVAEHDAAKSDLNFEELRAHGYQGDSRVLFQDNGHNIEQFAQSRQINNLDLDKPQNQIKTERQTNLDSERQTNLDSERQTNLDSERQTNLDYERQQSDLKAERQQVLDNNRHYLTFGQSAVISQGSSATTVSSQLLNMPPTKGNVTVPQINGRLSPVNSESHSSTKSELLNQIAGPSSALDFEQKSALTPGRSAALTPGHSQAISPGQSSTFYHGNSAPYQADNVSDPRLPFQKNHTDASSSSSDNNAKSHLSSSQGNLGNAQMYAEIWQHLGASSGYSPGFQTTSNRGSGYSPGFQTTSNRGSGSASGLEAVANSSKGNTEVSKARFAQRDQPNPHFGRDSQGMGNSFLEEYEAQDSDIRTGQTYSDSAPENENAAGLGNLGQIISTPRPSGQSRSRGGERSRTDVLSFGKKDLDDIYDDVAGIDGEIEDRDHFNIVEDLIPKFVGLKLETQPSKPMRSDKPGFLYFCSVCNKHMNTREAYQAHIQGKNHLYSVSNSPAPDRQLGPNHKIYNGQDLVPRVCNMIDERLKITPRSYQIELVEKAMTRDCIIYLPTGTGKTLVAVLTMGLMLQENPSRPVLFLVDKVLLVMQQAQYIMNHFAGTLFKRQDPEGALVNRLLKVKPICGGLTTKTDIPIWRHDIVVTTAAYCFNMLNNGLLRWKDFSLVVLDEVHHCNKGHPYHKLMLNYHNVLPEVSRAKVLGLTASPAGKSTVQQTYIMLKSLLTNLGGATVAIVETEMAVLDKYQSMAKVRAICVPMTSKEKTFKCHLLEYLILCYSKLAKMTTNLQSDVPPCSYFKSALDKPGDREVAMELANRFIQDPEPLWEVLSVIYNSQCKDEENYELKNFFDNLKLHICQLLLVIPEVGSGTGMEELLKALTPSPTTEEFKKMGLPCQAMFERVKHFEEDGNNDLTMFNKLVETLQDPDVINWSDMSSRALVLVRERKRARQYCHKLRGHPMAQNKGLRVGYIVGHGKGAKDGGMDVKKQRKVFDNHEKFHILVATSIMEEGIDIEALQLVVCMNPPNSLRALVQMRGRARREESHFVVLCSSEEDVDKLDNLQKQETHMMKATSMCLQEGRHQD